MGKLLEVIVNSWMDEYGDRLRAVAMEKTMMATLLLLVVAIGGFNIVAGQIMMVNDKRSDIAILRTMGARSILGAQYFSTARPVCWGHGYSDWIDFRRVDGDPGE